MAWNKAGKGQKGQGKGKRGGKKSDKFHIRSSPLSLDECKKRLAKLKKDTRCKDCGEKGHWAGDPECKKSKSQLQKTASYACSSCGPKKDDIFWTQEDSDDEESAFVAEFYALDELDSDDDYMQFNSDVRTPASAFVAGGDSESEWSDSALIDQSQQGQASAAAASDDPNPVESVNRRAAKEKFTKENDMKRRE